MKTITKVAQAIKKADNFLITSHINPEGDSLGSQLAVATLVASLGKNFIIVNNDKVPGHYRFLPKAHLITHSAKAPDKKFNTSIVVDCPNLKRTGRVKAFVEKTDFIINIDHHPDNKMFGNVNWAEKDASSAGEMIYRLYKELECKITKEAALYLYISILTDTGSFNYSNTSSATHEVISELLGHGIEPYTISKKIYENKTLGEMKLLGRVLSNIKVDMGGKVAYMVVRKKDFKETKTTPLACENFVNFARSLESVDVAFVMRENIKKSGIFNVSFRSKGIIDVGKIASFFGGGGHKNASGCTVKGEFSLAKKRILKRIKDELKMRHSTSR